MVNLPILTGRSNHLCFNTSFRRSSFRCNSIPVNPDHSRRLIQTAYACFQQLNECTDLKDEQKQWIQTWMEAVSNVRHLFRRIEMIWILFEEE